MHKAFIIFGSIVIFVGAYVGFASYVLGRQVVKYREYWKDRAEAPAADDAVYYFALGDSAAQGIGAGSPANGYVGLLASAMEEKYEQPLHVVNLSVSGAKVNDVLHNQLPALKKQMTDRKAIITVAIGANDMANFNESAFSDDIEQLFAELPRSAIVGDIPYFGGGRALQRESTVIRANEILRKHAARQNLQIAPLYDKTKQNDSLRMYSWDFFHPNNRGYKNWFDAFWEHLRHEP